MKNHQDSPQTPTELLESLRGLVAEAETMVSQSGSGEATDLIDSLRSRIAAAQERVSDAFAKVRKNVVAGAKCTDETIRANPYQSLAVAAGIGLLVGIMIGRRSK